MLPGLQSTGRAKRGAALAGLALIGPSGALLALPVAAMVQAIGSASGRRHDVIDSELTVVAEPLPRARRWRRGT